MPVGFKWFVPGLLDGSVGFGGEESAGASFLQLDGAIWTTDKDGIILALLASEITAVTGLALAAVRRPHRPVRRARLRPDRHAGQPGAEGCSGQALTRPGHRQRARGREITAKLTTAPGNGAPIGGLKVVTDSGWFAARPSGTEDVYKLYAESFRGPAHLAAIQEEAQAIVAAALDSGKG